MNSPKEIAQNYIQIGVGKINSSVAKTFVLAILAGAFIAAAGVGSMLASVGTVTPSLGKLLTAMVFPGGLAMVLLAGSELFTGNSLLIIPVLEHQAKFSGLIKNWVVVYIGNLVGGILVAACVSFGGIFNAYSYAAGATVITTALTKVSIPFGEAILRGIMCNFLVCIAVWISFAAKDVTGKIVGIFFPIMLFVVSGFEHSVANMYYIAAGLFSLHGKYAAFYTPNMTTANVSNLTRLTWGNMFIKNLLPVTIGNIIGGLVFVGIAYWFVYLHKSASETQALKKKK